MRAVVDTNVLVSATINADGSPRRVIDACREGRFTLVLSEALLDEFRRALTYPKVSRRIRHPSQAFLTMLYEVALIVDPEPVAAVLRDPTDDVVMGTAISGEADFVVTGDRDLLALNDYQGVVIVRPAEFLGLLDEIEHLA